MVEKKEIADEEEKVVEIAIERLRSFEDHPFKIMEDRQMRELQVSVKKYGIVCPLIVRPKIEGYYEIISGHRRKWFSKPVNLNCSDNVITYQRA